MKAAVAPTQARADSDDSCLDVVTGAFSYSGAAIAKALIAHGRSVRTVTAHPARGHGRPDIEARPLDFDDQLGLVASLQGATTLYNTYWVRFARRRIDHEVAVANSRTLFQAAKRAGVQRIVHISITNPSIESPFPYFRGKALVERSLAECGVSYAILRPAILFGGDGVLINNIAWLVRRLPVFAVGGDGNYRIRGIHVEDLARLCLEASKGTGDSVTDAVGPARPTFDELVTMVREAVGARTRVVHVPGALLPPISSLLGLALHDVLLTPDEYRAMAAGLADTDGPSTGSTDLSTWISDNRNRLGLHYANELRRHFS
jgi:nucleoside-diphosphate-sugar epimerase